MATAEWPLRRDLHQELPNGDYIEVTCGLHQLPGNDRPHWSVTYALWEKRGTRSGIGRKRHGDDWDRGGCAGELITAVFPQLAPVIAVHNVDDRGVPMHAVSNGWYFYSGEASAHERSRGMRRSELTDHQRAAAALHIPARELPTGLDQAGFKSLAKSLKPRWQAMSDAARRALEAVKEPRG